MGSEVMDYCDFGESVELQHGFPIKNKNSCVELQWERPVQYQKKLLPC